MDDDVIDVDETEDNQQRRVQSFKKVKNFEEEDVNKETKGSAFQCVQSCFPVD